MTIVIDNYDSFTYNLVQLVAGLGETVKVVRNDACTPAELAGMRPDRILISPGPGRPEHAGICVEAIRSLGPEIPILGVCLGHQAIGYAFGGTIERAPRLMHGKTSEIRHDGTGLYRSVPSPFPATRYHSLVVSPGGLPGDLAVTATSDDGQIMGIRHRRFPVEGIQFHPESILTAAGETIMRNWLTPQGEPR